jgi:hypothetical protein
MENDPQAQRERDRCESLYTEMVDAILRDHDRACWEDLLHGTGIGTHVGVPMIRRH